jgi:glutaredoxin
MFTFYRTPQCPGCNHIQEALERLVIAHKVITVHSVEEIRDKIPSVTTLPALVDEEKVVQGSDLIVARLEEIEKFKELWDKFQSDACSCDEEALKFNIKLLSKADRGGDEESTSRSMTRRQQRYAHEGDLV